MVLKLTNHIYRKPSTSPLQRYCMRVCKKPKRSFAINSMTCVVAIGFPLVRTDLIFDYKLYNIYAW